MEIRIATIDDHSGISSIAIPVHSDHATHSPDRFRAGVNPMPLDRLIGLLKSPDCLVLVAENDQVICGFIVTCITDAPLVDVYIPRRTAFVDIIAVAPDARGGGVGRSLMDAAAEWGRTMEASELGLSVFEWNAAAIAFYERFGLSTNRRRMTMRL